MNTYWLVTLLIGLLVFDFYYRNRDNRPIRRHRPRSIPPKLLALCALIAIFCLGLAWRYYSESLPSDEHSISGWLPIVLIVLASSIVVGFLETWRSEYELPQPLDDPFRLLESAIAVKEPFVRASSRYRKPLLQLGVLLTSTFIGWAGASMLLTVRDYPDSMDLSPTRKMSDSISPIKVSPLPQPLYAADHEPNQSDDLNADRSPLLTHQQEKHPASLDDRAFGIRVDTLVNDKSGGEPLQQLNTAIGGPVTEDIIYQTMIQAPLGVKARSQPSTQAEVLAVIAPKQQLNVLGRTANSEWIRIEYKEGLGAWIFTEASGGSVFDQYGTVKQIESLQIIATIQ